MDFFNRNNYLRKFVNINKNKKITTYSLTKKGKDAITLRDILRNIITLFNSIFCTVCDIYISNNWFLG